MSDPARKDFTQKAKEAMTPETHKTTGEKIKESITGFADKITGKATPSTEKSLPQQVHDNLQSKTDNNTDGVRGSW